MPQGNISTPDAADLDTDARRYCAEQGWAMPDGSYPIRPADMHGAQDLQKAIRAVGRGSASAESIRRHIIKRARALGMTDMLPDTWSAGGSMTNRSRSTAEIEIRNSTLEGVDRRQRLIDMIAVPWDQEADVLWRGEVWHESFDRNSFNGIEEHAGRVRVNRQHKYGDTVGKVVQFDPKFKAGLLTRAKIAETSRGDETLALAEEDCLSPSVGYEVRGFADMRIDRHRMTRRINRAFMDHLSLVEDPTYPGAKVVAVRAESSGLMVVEQRPLPDSPLLDEFVNDPLFAWATERLDR